MKKLLVVLLAVIMITSLTACREKESEGFKIPDVFGVDYSNALEILEGEGFEVKAIETDVDGISEKLLYPIEKVTKGVVFKIDDYILDNLGNLTKDYDVFYEGELISEDKNLVIYYAKENYVLNKEENINSDTTNNQSSEDNSNTEKNEKLNSDFKSAMDSYEKFMNEYVDFMKKYKANPSDISLLADYAGYMSEYSEFVADFEKWENEEMNAVEAAYYVDVQARVSKKLLEVTK